jgi:2-C-methyl-D-erythritol 4-phosphate cytidylyltransferase/2-C-methyl-D-erythritol 2,4-cyclodiphosphate synthase
MKCWAIIVAAGRGTRAGFDINKVYMPLGSGTVLEKCLRTFEDSGLFQGVTVVISEADRELYDAISAPDIVRAVTVGGSTRQESVYRGLATAPEDVDIVAVHDAARPFVTKEIIAATLASAMECGSGVISTPVTDTIKQLEDDGRVTTLNRAALYSVQTPQSFRRDMLMDAHEKAVKDGFTATDDAALYERYCGNLRLVTAPGAENNIKLTHKKDFGRRTMDIRIGHGYDAHRLKEGRRLVLCGVEIPSDLGLDGHSDADVALHALMDAMLGAAAMGDIGRLFPDSDDRYLGISSLKLLDEVVRRLASAGYKVSNADITIIAQRPKLSPYMEQMRRVTAEALGIGTERVNVKATTTERMGFEGAGEGISSHAVVTIREVE